MTRSGSHLGEAGEQAAKAYLQAQGFTILHENYATPLGEIDLIAREGEVTVFVEVKARTTDTFGPPEASVTLAKQRQIAKVAALFLQREGLGASACRFDVVSVSYRGAAGPEIRLIRDAFSAGAAAGG
jgi:putative endonuclease